MYKYYLPNVVNKHCPQTNNNFIGIYLKAIPFFENYNYYIKHL